MDNLQRSLSSDNEERGLVNEEFGAFTLSWRTRLKCFVVFYVLGIIVSFTGSLCLFLSYGIEPFSLMYTLGNLVSLVSVCFLMGPINQIKMMIAPTRVVATLMMFVMFGVTLYAGIGMKNAALAMVFCILQYFAMTWYSLSYIPFARDCVICTVACCFR